MILAVLMTTVLWDPVTLDCQGRPETGPVTYRVYIFDNRCVFDAGGAPVYDIDNAGSSHPRCTAQGNHVTASAAFAIEEPRPNEVVGWDGMLEGQLPVIGSVDPANNETRTDRGCP